MLFTLLLTLPLRAADDLTKIKINDCIEKYSQYSQLFPQEKVYLHFDNTEYYQGENIWFKAYVVTAANNNLTPYSKTLYVELVNQQGRIIQTQKLKITNGQTNGCICLDMDEMCSSGFYEVRAYTRYMLNQGGDAIFSRVFPIFEPPHDEGVYNRDFKKLPPSQQAPNERKNAPKRDKSAIDKKLCLTFFPEGGELIAALTSNVAFKVTEKSGKSIYVQGYIANSNGDTITSLRTAYQGMGTFSLTPQSEEQYTVHIKYNNKTYDFNLPEIKPTGYVLNISHQNEQQLAVVIQKTINENPDTLGLIITCRGKIYTANYITFKDKNITGISLAESLLPSGVAQVTLFNAQKEALCERKVFINHTDYLNIAVQKDKDHYAPNELVNLDFKITDAQNQPVETDFSVAVRDNATSNCNPYGQNALSNLLLSSDLKGYIENPDFYFEKNDLIRQKALDLLMLTQGWTRYVWKKMINVDQEHMTYPVEEFLSLEGKVLSPKRKREPEENVDVKMFLQLPNNMTLQGQCTTDSAGIFNFALTDFYGDAHLTLKTKTDGKAKPNYIILDRVFSPERRTFEYAETQLTQPIQATPQKNLTTHRQDTIIEYQTEVTIGDKAEEDNNDLPMDQKVHNINEVNVNARKKIRIESEGLLHASIVYNVQETLDDMLDKEAYEPADLLHYFLKVNDRFGLDANGDLRYKAKKLIYVLNNNSSALDSTVLNELNSISLDEIGMITIDEEPTDICKYVDCRSIPPDVKIIFIYTNEKYTQGKFKTQPGMRKTSYKGYTQSKEFYQPDYSQSTLPSDSDYRRTLYWNPNVKTNRKGEASIAFYNNNTCRDMNISAETVTQSGQIGVFGMASNLTATCDTSFIQLDNYLRKYRQYSDRYPQEKVFLHFDNTSYYKGEKMWFKAYVVTAAFNELTAWSRILYVELITPAGQIIETQKLKIVNGQADGCFDLGSDELRLSGFYEVRAYTRYMLNQGTDGIFSRVLPVFEKGKKPGEYERTIEVLPPSMRVPQDREVYDQKQKVALSFFPEGGDLVEGLTSNIAFKATGNAGEDLAITGTITDLEGHIIDTISTSYQGMGQFQFTPHNEPYVVNVQYKKKEFQFNLPEILTHGYVMTTTQHTAGTYEVNIQKSADIHNDTIGLVVTCRGEIYVSDHIIISDKKEYSVSISKEELPTGVSEITLFDKEGKALNERKIFVNRHDQLSIMAQQDKANYQPYEDVNLDFNIKDTEGQPVKTTFSVAVRDGATSAYHPYAADALTDLLLSSDIKGYIDHPGYYFENNDTSRTHQLDLLMLTQGWTRYSWDKMVTKKETSSLIPIEKNLHIDGNVLGTGMKRKPIPDADVKIVMELQDSSIFHIQLTTDSRGNFNFDVPDFVGKGNLIIQTTVDGKKKSNWIVLNRFFSPELKTYDYAETQLSLDSLQPQNTIIEKQKSDTIIDFETEVSIGQKEKDDDKESDMTKKVHNINEVNVKVRKRLVLKDEGLRNASIVYNVQETIDEIIDNKADQPDNLNEYMMDMSDDYSITNGRYKGKNIVYVLNNESPVLGPMYNSGVSEELRALLLEEIGMMTISEDPADIMKYATPTAVGSTVIVFIYTNEKYTKGRPKVIPGMRRTTFKGYACTKQFFNPDYSIKDLPKDPDYRRTLYWNPNVTTDENGHAGVSFYNNSSCTQMNISAETVTEDGQIGVVK